MIHSTFAVDSIFFIDYDLELNVTNTSELYDYCVSQLPDIPHSDVQVLIEFSNSTSLFYHYCRVESERGVFLGSTTTFPGRLKSLSCVCTVATGEL